MKLISKKSLILKSVQLNFIDLRDPFNDPLCNPFTSLVETSSQSLEIQLFNDSYRSNIVWEYLGHYLPYPLFKRQLH